MVPLHMHMHDSEQKVQQRPRLKPKVICLGGNVPYQFGNNDCTKIVDLSSLEI